MTLNINVKNTLAEFIIYIGGTLMLIAIIYDCPPIHLVLFNFVVLIGIVIRNIKKE